ncbi:MAG: hypothetical protein KDA79_11580, partial [Planctomycetaceae bacterium]|nr:hypothetical protein [Planctomycetaceae bacterium]
LLLHLTTIDGPDLWVGMSHSLFNFCARDTCHEFDGFCPLASVKADISGYQISCPTPVEFNAVPDSHVTCHAPSVEEAGRKLLTAFAYSDSNPDRPSAQWNWFVCPRCDFHSVEYRQLCFRCDWAFPPERKSMAVGLYRRPRLPAGAVSLSRSMGSSEDS